MNVELHVDALVLEGLPRVDPGRLIAAVERELTQLVIDRGPPGDPRSGGSQLAAADRVVTVPADAGVDQIGAAVARALYAGVGG